MKFTRKYQQGEGFAIYTPSPYGAPGVEETVASNSGATSTSDKTQGSIISEELYKELIKSGGEVLPNEWTSLVTKIQSLASTSNLPYLEQDTITKTLEAMGELNTLKRNKELWDDAYDTAKSNNSLNELAINDLGQVYVKDRKGKISMISISDYQRRKDRVQTITVSELLEHRQFDSNFIHNTSAFNVANNAVSIDTIHDYIEKVVKVLGKESNELTTTISREEGINKVNLLRELSQTGRTPSNEELKGLELLYQIAESPEDAERILMNTPGDNIEVSRKVSSQRGQVLKAAKYIWSTLDRQSQNRLRIQGIENGIENPSEFIITMLSVGATHDVSESYTPKKAVTGEGSGSGVPKTDNLNNPQMMIQGVLGTENYIFNTIDRESKDIHGVISAAAAGTTSLVDIEGGNIRETTFDNFLGAGGWGEVVDERSIYFGGNHLPSYEWEDIALLQGNDLITVYLPATKDEYGRITPNIDSLKDYGKVVEKYKDEKDALSRAQIIKMFRDEGFTVTLDENNNIINTVQEGYAVRPFLITTAYTRRGADVLEDNLDEMDKGLSKLTGPEAKATKDRLKLAYTDLSKGSKKDRGPRGFLGGKTPYKGILYMPLRDGATARLRGALDRGPLSETPTAEDVNIQSRQSSGIPFVNPGLPD